MKRSVDRIGPRKTTGALRALGARAGLCLSLALGVSSAGGCQSPQAQNAAPRVAPTLATVDVLHAGVTLERAAGGREEPFAVGRLEQGGTVRTTAAGRAVVRTDDGIELRLAGDTEVRASDTTVRVVRGRAFVSSWGTDERPVEVSSGVTLSLSDAALEAEVAQNGSLRVIAVRGEAGWRAQGAQGRLPQGDMLEGDVRTPRVRPAGVWDDWTGGAASPQGAAPRGALGSGRAFLRSDSGDAPTMLAINEYNVRVEVEGDLAITSVSQRFFNGSPSTAPVEYRIRLPEGATVVDYAVENPNSPLVRSAPGIVAELGSDGGRPALAALSDGSLYARLDALAPGAAVRCVLRYAEWLPHREGRRAYAYPMGDPVDPPFVGDFNFELVARKAHAVALRGPAGSQLVENGEALRFARSDFRPRADLYVDLFDDTAQPNTDQAAVHLWQTPATFSLEHAERFVMADVTLPAPRARGTDLVLLLDTSAGTDASVLNTAAAAVNAVLQQLGPDDRVALAFGDLRGRAAPGAAGQLGAADATRRAAILEAIAQARPAGASNLVRAIADAHAMLDPTRNGSVIYLGDANPTMGTLDPARVADEALRVAPDLRLYVVSLGPDAHPEVLSRLTRRGGLEVRASDTAEAVTAAVRLAAHATRPVLRDVRVDLGTGVSHPLPAVQEQWVAGEPLRVFGEITGALPRTVTIEARGDGGQRLRWTTNVAPTAVREEGDLRRRWGRARFDALREMGASQGVLADLGMRFGLVTTSSALVLGASAADGTGGYVVSGPVLLDAVPNSRLPRLGVRDEVEPRGVRSLAIGAEYPAFEDNEDGWPRHEIGETNAPEDVLSEALALAEPAAQACVNRARSARPALTGSMRVSARIDAQGALSDVRAVESTLNDAGAEACVRRVVSALRLPPPAMLGAAPGVAERYFDFEFHGPPRSTRGCPATSRLERRARVALWRERALGTSPLDLWNGAETRCEFRVWEDRAAMLDLLVAMAQPEALADLRGQLDETSSAYLDRAVARRYGPSRVWRAYLANQGRLNWDPLLRHLADPAIALAQQITEAEAYRQLAPDDIDLRLRLMNLYERAGRVREAQRIAEELRREPFSDARVLALAGELYLRTNARDEGLRTFTEIAEHAPYDTRARQRLGDLLLTYGGEAWAEDAYAQYRTLLALRPGDALVRVRMALAARAAGREDESLRLLRSVAEEGRGEDFSRGVEAMLVQEVWRSAQRAANDPALQPWMRTADLLDLAREGGVVLRWSHPEAGLTLRTMAAGDTEYSYANTSGEIPVLVFAPGTALEGSRLVVRAGDRVAGGRSISARVSVLLPAEGGPRIADREVTLDARHRTVALLVRNGALVDDPTPLPLAEQLPALTSSY